MRLQTLFIDGLYFVEYTVLGAPLRDIIKATSPEHAKAICRAWHDSVKLYVDDDYREVSLLNVTAEDTGCN